MEHSLLGHRVMLDLFAGRSDKKTEPTLKIIFHQFLSKISNISCFLQNSNLEIWKKKIKIVRFSYLSIGF
jgi:hypothetical protein